MVSTVALPARDHHFPPGSQYQRSQGSPNRRSPLQRDEGIGDVQADEDPETPAKIWIKSFASSGLLGSQADGTSSCENGAQGGSHIRFAAVDAPSVEVEHDDEDDAPKIDNCKSLEALSRRRLVSTRVTVRGNTSWQLPNEPEEDEEEEEEILRQASSSSSDEGAGRGAIFHNIFSMRSTVKRKGTGCTEDRSSLWQQYDFLEAMNHIRKSVASAFTAAPLSGDQLSDESGEEDSNDRDDQQVASMEGPASGSEEASPALPEFQPELREAVAIDEAGQSAQMVQTLSSASTRGESFLARQIRACDAYMCCRAKPPRGTLLPAVKE